MKENFLSCNIGSVPYRVIVLYSKERRNSEGIQRIYDPLHLVGNLEFLNKFWDEWI